MTTNETLEFKVPECVCGGETWVYLGSLGFTAHFRCRACGFEVQVDVLGRKDDGSGDLQGNGSNEDQA